MFKYVLSNRVLGYCMLITFGVLFFFQAEAAHPAEGHFKQEGMANLLSLAGEWRGTLSYLDYGTGNKEAIGMAASISVTPDDAFLVTQSRFTDPGFDVFIMTLMTLDPETGDMIESFHRDRQIEHYRYPVKHLHVSKTGWTVICENKGRDADRPATIRRIFSLEGDIYTQRKEVDFLDDGQLEFFFRNESVLVRSEEQVSFDDFRKR